MKWLDDNRGMTLLETVLSFAIISILLVSILTFFAGGLRIIFGGGERTKNVFDAQTLINRAIQDENIEDDKIDVQEDEEISIVFKDSHNNDINTGNINGRIITVSSLGKKEVLIKTFVPRD